MALVQVNNALYTASLKPNKYVLVEPNASAVDDINKTFCNVSEFNKTIIVENCMLSEFKYNAKFDIVICEGILTAIPDPKTFINEIRQFVKIGGVLIITCNDSITYLSEIIRRLFGSRIIDRNKDINYNIDRLLPYFGPTLQKLKGMTRSHNDWLIDNIINPTSLEYVFSIPEAINSLEKDYDFYNICPSFYIDWRWYKSLTVTNRDYNQRLFQQYWENIHSFLDHTKVFKVRNVIENKILYNLCDLFRNKCIQYENNKDSVYFDDALILLAEVASEIDKFSTRISKSLIQVIKVIKQEHIEVKDFNNIPFTNMWGRGQQYISFCKK